MKKTNSKQQGLSPTGKRIAIVMGLRTPFAKQATVLHGLSALELGKLLVSELLQRADLSAKSVEKLVYGQVIQMPQAPNIAREIVLGTEMDVSTDAYSVTRACATGFQSVVSLAQAIALGEASIGVAGGADSSSVLPIGVSKALAGALLDISKTRSLKQKLTILSSLKIKELLPVSPAVAEYSTGMTMGQSAEQMAKTHGISRQQQDNFAHRSHTLAHESWQQGKLESEVMVAHVPPYRDFIEQDNTVRQDSTIEGYARLKPAFDKKYGTVTAGNSSPLTDGASALLLMDEDKAHSLGYRPIGYIRSYAFTAIDVWQDMLLGPSYATPLALARAGCSLKDLSLIEMHEAFSAQVLANIKMFSSKHFANTKLNQAQAIGEIDMDKFNVMGGSLAYGHPFAATGVRLITQLCHELQRRGGGLGLATACAAGGLGAAMVVEVE